MSGTGHRYIGDSTTAALHIDNARLEDDGLWKCIIDGDRGEILTGRSVKLVILGKTNQIIIKSKINYLIYSYDQLKTEQIKFIHNH